MVVNAEELGVRFDDACNRIDGTLRRRHNLTTNGLGKTLREVRHRDKTVRRYGRTLDAIVELRNVLAHEPLRRGMPIAVPSAAIVDDAEKIARELGNPTPIREAMSKPLGTISRGDWLAPTLKEMALREFSQLLVVDEFDEIVLLTTNTIARWVAAQIDDAGDLLIERVNIGEVLECAEVEPIRAVRPDRPIIDVIDMLSGARPVCAVVVTPRATLKEEPMGIVVPYDVPAMYKLVELPQ